jgi:dihydroorotate dehydrogenase (NAD+) catalytic subunit
VRIAETAVGMLNSIGLANPGIDAFVDSVLPRLLAIGPAVWVSVGGFSAPDYELCCAALDACEGVASIELNLSCPNVDSPLEGAAELVAAARSATSRPLYAKLSPMDPDIAATARAAEAAGADGLSLVNTIRGLAFDRELRPILGRGTGGLSGPALKPIALAAVHACRSATGLPIVGMGGIASGRDALELLAAGASAVALGTVLFTDPAAPARIRRELESDLLLTPLATVQTLDPGSTVMA